MNALPVLAEGPDMPGVGDFFPPIAFGEGTIFAFDKIMFIRLVVAGLLILLLWLGTRKATLVPSRGQSAIEFVLDFVRVQIVEQILGKERGRPYVPFLTAMFFTIFAMNIAGIIPGLGLAGTSRMGLPLLMAVIVLLVYLVAGVRKQGMGKYLKSQLFPPGIPPVAYVLITPIEILQVFILRPATLAVRLLANMMAGHIMLAVALVGTHFLLIQSVGMLKGAGALAFVAAIAVTLFEVFVAALQTYIFVLLSAIYINFALEEAH
ncbi:MAG TPA: F0F1 ATP synthase subunit A [Beutenbergiaceae bacterium]|nr:F0F1 ATP synthase subunit A [Beutenbergiaceae bacterium]